MATHRKSLPSHRSRQLDLESQGFAPEYIPTATEQSLILCTHIVRSFGMTIALLINAIIFIPFFIFAILPICIYKHFYPTPAYTPRSPSDFTLQQQQRERGIFCCLDRPCTLIPDEAISPLLLSAATSISDFAPYSYRAAKLRGEKQNRLSLSTRKITTCTTGRGCARRHFRVSKLHASSRNHSNCAQGSNRSVGSGKEPTRNQALLVKPIRPVDRLEEQLKSSCGHASGVNIRGPGQVIKRERSTDKEVY